MEQATSEREMIIERVVGDIRQRMRQVSAFDLGKKQIPFIRTSELKAILLDYLGKYVSGEFAREIEKVQSQMKALQDENRILKEEKQAQADEIARLRKEIEDLNAKIRELEEMVNTLHRTIDARDQEIRRLNILVEVGVGTTDVPDQPFEYADLVENIDYDRFIKMARRARERLSGAHEAVSQRLASDGATLAECKERTGQSILRLEKLEEKLTLDKAEWTPRMKAIFDGNGTVSMVAEVVRLYAQGLGYIGEVTSSERLGAALAAALGVGQAR